MVTSFGVNFPWASPWCRLFGEFLVHHRSRSAYNCNVDNDPRIRARRRYVEHCSYAEYSCYHYNYYYYYYYYYGCLLRRCRLTHGFRAGDYCTKWAPCCYPTLLSSPRTLTKHGLAVHLFFPSRESAHARVVHYYWNGQRHVARFPGITHSHHFRVPAALFDAKHFHPSLKLVGYICRPYFHTGHPIESTSGSERNQSGVPLLP